MHLFALTITMATVMALPDIQPHNGALFQQQGFLVGGLSWAHITAPIDISKMSEDANQFQNFTKYFYELSQPLKGVKVQLSIEERTRMRVLKNLSTRRLNKMANIISDLRADLGNEGTLIHREKRQIAIGIAAIGGLIVGAVSGSLFSQFKTTALVDILEKRVQTVTHQVEQNSIAIFQNAQDIRNINTTLGELEKVFEQLMAKDVVYDHYFAGIFSTLLLEEQNERFTLAEDAIDQLFMGKLHKGLVSPKGLDKALKDIQKRALDQGLLIGVKKPLELYQLPTSFVYNHHNDILHVIVHVPMYRESHILQLQRYIPIPFYAPSLEKFVQVNSDAQYLARSPDGTLLKTLSEHDLNACLNIGHAYFCEDHALEKPSETNCLLQLFSGLKEINLEQCDLHILPRATKILQTTKNQYIISTSEPISITQTCLRTNSNTPLKLSPGTYSLEINPNCTTSSEYWVIYPSLQIEDVQVKTTVIPYDFDIGTLHGDMNEEELKILRNSIQRIGRPVPLAQMTQLATFQREIAKQISEYKITHFLFGTGTTMSIAITFIVILVAGVFCYRRCRNRRQQDPAQPTEHQEYIPMVPVINQPRPTPTHRQPSPAAVAQASADTSQQHLTRSHDPSVRLEFVLPPKGTGSLSN